MSLLKYIMRHALAGFKLDPRSNAHGVPHWVRVWNHGRRLAEQTPGFNGHHAMQVLAWFAFLHDSRRESDGADPRHGHRAAEYAKRLWEAGAIALDPEYMFMLKEALEGHSSGYLIQDPVVQVCWDADRLDLGRVGINPDPRRMCTPAGAEIAREMARQRLPRSLWREAGGPRHAKITAPQLNKGRIRP